MAAHGALRVNRPVALLCCPGGTEGLCFFSETCVEGLSREILTFHDPLDDDDEPLVAVTACRA